MAFLLQLQHCIAPFSIIAQPTVLLPDFSFFITIVRMVAIHYLDIDLFIPIGQRGLSFSKKVFRKDVTFFIYMAACQAGP